MKSGSFASGESGNYQLCFRSLFQAGRGYAFPCDEAGRVDMDSLSDRARANYLYARAVVGRDYASPVLERCSD
jgi:hypothetical protein